MNIIVSKKSYAFLLPAALLLSVCALVFNCIYLSGDINDRMAEKAEKAMLVPLPLIVNSNGGSARYAEIISHSIYNKNKSILVLGNCLSACAEYFIPAAKHVYVTSKSLIGYHVSDFMAEDYFRSPDDLKKYCGFKRLVWLKFLYKERELNSNFYKITYKILQFKPIYNDKLFHNDNCTEVITTQGPAMWFPDSEQLKSDLGLNIDNKICSDSQYCWGRRLSKLGGLSSGYIVGSKLVAHKK